MNSFFEQVSACVKIYMCNSIRLRDSGGGGGNDKGTESELIELNPENPIVLVHIDELINTPRYRSKCIRGPMSVLSRAAFGKKEQANRVQWVLRGLK